MTLHAVTSIAESPRESRKVKTVAAMLEMDESQIRRMEQDGELEGHGHGKRGLRIYLDSVIDWQKRHARASERPGDGKVVERRRRAASAAHNEAMEELRADGWVS
jgi:hypothetical protein